MQGQGTTDAQPSTTSGQRRYVTVMFADLCDSTELGGRMEAEHYVEMLRALRAACRKVIVRHGGHIARLQGDGLLAVFGFPESKEDDGRRACEAALELHHTIGHVTFPEFGLPQGALALHSGIHAGLTFVQGGGVEVGTLELLGDVPNTAARLCSLAERNQIVVSEETLGAEVHFFDTYQHEIAQLRGRTHALAICRVRHRSAVHRRFEARAVRGLAPFVGREIELQMLLDCVDATTQGKPRCVAVIGEPGLGKTRLVEEVLRTARAANGLALHGYCESYLSAEPLQPFLQILRAVCGIEPGTPAQQAASRAEISLAALTGLPQTLRAELLRTLSLSQGSALPRSEAGMTVDAYAALIDTLASERPLLLVLDDWQWADELSQRVLDSVLSLTRPVAVLLASRAESASLGLLPRAASLLELAPLALDETRRTLAHLLPQADPLMVGDIHRYGGGVPLFIEELCHSVTSQRLKRPSGQRLTGAAWLAGLVESRVERLPFEQRELVRVAAVMGNTFPSWLLERITGHSEDAPLVRALADQDLIFPAEQPGIMRFKHGVTRDVIYEAVGLDERKALHLRVAEALRTRNLEADQESLLEALAYHYTAGGMPPEAARFAELAGDKAMAAFALDRARAQYATALNALDAQSEQAADPRQWCALSEKLGMAIVFDPLALHDGVAIFERALRLAQLANDARALARAHYWLAYIHYAKGNSLETMRHCEQALALAQHQDERLSAQVRATLGQALHCACEYDRAMPLIDMALQAKRSRGRAGSSVAVGSAYALACKGAMLGDRGLFVQADECFAESLALLGATTHQVASSVRNWISAVYQWQGRWQEAADIAEESMAIAERGKSRQLLAMSRSLWGHAHWMLTGREDGLQAVLDATTWIEERQGALVTSLNYGYLVNGAVAEARIRDARRHAARLFLRARRHDRLGEAMGCRALAVAAGQAGDFRAAERYLAQAERAAAARGSPHETASNQLCRAKLHAWQGQRSDCGAWLDSATAAFAAMSMHWHTQQAEQLRAQIG